MAEEIELWFHVASENLDDVKLQQLAQVYPQLIGQISSERDKKSSKQSERLDILDHYRYDELSQILASRMKDNGNSFLELDELKRLLEWKM